MWEIYLKVSDFFSPSGHRLMAPFPFFVRTGFSSVLPSHGLKCIRGQRLYQSHQQPLLTSNTALCWCLLHIESHKASGYQHLSTPATRNCRSFRDDRTDSCVAGERIKHPYHLQPSGNDYGLGREHIQAAAAALSTAQIGEHAQSKTAANVELYRYLTRHLLRVHRQKGSFARVHKKKERKYYAIRRYRKRSFEVYPGFPCLHAQPLCSYISFSCDSRLTIHAGADFVCVTHLSY